MNDQIKDYWGIANKKFSIHINTKKDMDHVMKAFRFLEPGKRFPRLFIIDTGLLDNV